MLAAYARRVLLAAVVVLVAVVAGVLMLLRLSLASHDGDVRLAGISAPVNIARDAAGVPTISAENHADSYFALGFLHAQERFFQMDLSRRVAGGELAELFGARAVPADRAARFHGLNDVAAEVIRREPPRRRALLEAYAQGVNAGLEELSAKPFEYWLTGTRPRPWRVEDSVLVLFAMYLDLTDERAERDAQRARIKAALPRDVAAWLTPDGGPLDAPIEGAAVESPPLPGARWFGARPEAAIIEAPGSVAEEAIGSNSWVVSGALTTHGGAMLANDMHLGLRVPNVWYRARLLLNAGDGGVVTDATGVTLPGLPGIVVGSNGHIAWGFTNSYGDWSDRVTLVAVPDAPQSYRTPRGNALVEQRIELIEIKGDDSLEMQVPVSEFGPVIESGADGRRSAVRWLAHRPAATNFSLIDLIDVSSVEAALDLANICGMPPQNIVVAGSDGKVGWTIAGRLPRRVGYDPRLPVESDSDGGWRGWLDASDYPRRIDPPGQRIWTANARVASRDHYGLIGLGAYPLGARAGQIRDRLRQRTQFSESDMLAIQLDDHGQFLSRWRALLLEVLSPAAVAGNPDRLAMRRAVEDGDLRASVDSVAYRLVREFRAQVENRLLDVFLDPVAAHTGPVSLRWLSQRENPLWETVTRKPVHLLPAGFSDWDSWLLSAVDGVLETTSQAGLDHYTWGAANEVSMTHPLAGALPGFLATRLNMPRQALPGDAWMPRVQGRSFGASERLVVAPGHEEDGIFHMPGGQSGHPLSPFYSSGHADWAEGVATPFLPGPVRYELNLLPEVASQ